MATLIKHFHSVDEVIEFIELHSTEHYGRKKFYGSDWEGCKQLMRSGVSDSEQRESRELIAKTDADFKGRMRPEWKASVAGPRISVPSYISGHPLAARRRKRVESAKAPVRVVVETLVSAGMEEKAIRKRGAAITALVAKLAETRPVELYASFAMQIYGENLLGTVRLQTKPIALAYLCAALNTRQFSRAIMFNAGRAMLKEAGKSHGGNIGWAWDMVPEDGMRISMVRKELELASQDIFVPGGYFTEQDIIIRDPVKWVNDMVAAQR